MEVTNDPQKIGTALRWITSLLNQREVPYQIVDGLAAKAYGATRPLVDIDIYAPFEKMRAVLEEIRPLLRSVSWVIKRSEQAAIRTNGAWYRGTRRNAA